MNSRYAHAKVAHAYRGLLESIRRLCPFKGRWYGGERRAADGQRRRRRRRQQRSGDGGRGGGGGDGGDGGTMEGGGGGEGGRVNWRKINVSSAQESGPDFTRFKPEQNNSTMHMPCGKHRHARSTHHRLPQAYTDIHKRTRTPPGPGLHQARPTYRAVSALSASDEYSGTHAHAACTVQHGWRVLWRSWRRSRPGHTVYFGQELGHR